MDSMGAMQPAKKHLQVLFQLLDPSNELRQWEFVSVIGHGANSTVYKVVRHDKTLGDIYCALKVITLSGAENWQVNEEIEIMNVLSHEKHAVHIYDCHQVKSQSDDNISYLLIRMELLEPLKIEKISEDTAVKIGTQLCSVLAACHNNEPKIYHCDIKPDNIFVDKNGDYKLGDFGESRMTERTVSSTGYRGTPVYMSPEMYNYLGYDGRSDIYSLGVTLYRLLNGKAPLVDEKNDERAALRKRLAGEEIPPVKGVSKRLNRVLLKACAYAPKDRFNDANEFSDALKGKGTGRTKGVIGGIVLMFFIVLLAAVLTFFALFYAYGGSERRSFVVSTGDSEQISAMTVTLYSEVSVPVKINKLQG